MRNELRAMCQSTSVRARNAAACLLATSSGGSGQIVDGGFGLPLNSIKAAVSLASKPSLLSTLIETVAKYSTLQLPRSNVPLACSCRPLRKISTYKTDWEYFSFSYRVSSTRRHLPGCRFSQINREIRSKTFTAEYSGLKRLLQTAFILSFSNTCGAGGRSISSNFNYYPVVNEDKAPAFRLIHSAMKIMFSVHSNWELHISNVERVLQYCCDNILILYSRGKASPKDVDLYGESIMHLVASFILGQPYKPDSRLLTDTMFSTVAKLVACGVPLTTQDQFGDTPCGRLLQGGLIVDITEFAKLLLPNAPDAPLFQKNVSHKLSVPFISGCATILSKSLNLAEAAGCESLSLAVLAGDERLVQDIIRRHPESILEVDQFGHTPLHLAISHPSCLRLIVEAGGSSILEHLNVYGQTPVECAWLNGCREATQFFLASESRIRLEYLHNVDKYCQNDVLIALKQRRGELKQLALDNFTRKEAESLRLHENMMLDTNAFEVQYLLQKRGVNIPSRLHVQGATQYTSVYHPYSRGNIVGIFDQLWALDFRDIDNFYNSEGLPVIEHRDLSVVRWLIEHGANYWTPCKERSDSIAITEPITPAHFVLARMGEEFRMTTEPLKFLQTHQWLVEKLLQVRVSDACSNNCPCSVSGCTPLKGFLDRMITLQYSPSSLQLEESAWICVYFIRTFQICIYQDDLMLFVRRMTFEALELIHTCCRITYYLWQYKGIDHTPDELDEINSEQSMRLNSFADLVSEFEQVAFEDQDGMPFIASDPEEFWIRRWLPRIQNLSGDDLTKEEMSAAEAIGVVWGPHPVNTIKSEDKKNELVWGSPDWAMREMEKIMDEI
ncbi:hypothetical protein F5B18DRAFT_622316 [Nemania serpens]|nr:hypothetical protein F5B18DRAFT_622316 [Nemania serpens]